MVVTQVGAIDAAVRSCEEVLLSQPENVKALYRLGKVLTAVKTVMFCCILGPGVDQWLECQTHD